MKYREIQLDSSPVLKNWHPKAADRIAPTINRLGKAVPPGRTHLRVGTTRNFSILYF